MPAPPRSSPPTPRACSPSPPTRPRTRRTSSTTSRRTAKGFESAVAYAVARKLGYAQDKVKWVVEPFDSSYAPGPKSFDFDINEISITPARAKVVTFSTPYYTNPQGILVKAGSPLCACRSRWRRSSRPRSACRSAPHPWPRCRPASSPASSPRCSTPPTMSSARSRSDRVNAIVVDLATALRAHLRAEAHDDRRSVQRRRRRPMGPADGQGRSDRQLRRPRRRGSCVPTGRSPRSPRGGSRRPRRCPCCTSAVGDRRSA